MSYATPAQIETIAKHFLIAGFWCRDELKAENLGKRISALCGSGTAFPENGLYIGDDGKAYFETMTTGAEA